MTVQNEAILIEIDTILETRLGTVDLLNREWAEKLAMSEYRHRLSDDFNLFVPEIDMDLYKKTYAKRDWEVLAHSAPTEFSVDLTRILDELLFDPKRISPNATTEIHVNIYPYDLTDAEKIEMVQAIHEITATVFYIKLVNIPSYSITFETIKANNWVAIFAYDLNLILSNMITMESIKGKLRCNNVMLYTPHITFNFDELKKTVEETTAMGEKFEPFMHTSLLLAPFISLEFVSSEYYSLADFDKHEKTTRFEEEMYDETNPYTPPVKDEPTDEDVPL